MTISARRTTVADAMVRSPKVNGPATTVAQACAVLRDDHVHAVLIVDDGKLIAVVERPDLGSASPDAPAHLSGRLQDRVVEPEADLEQTRRSMNRTGRRRLAVTDRHGTLLGLLCLKRTGQGFCSDDGIQARAREHRAAPPSEAH